MGTAIEARDRAVMLRDRQLGAGGRADQVTGDPIARPRFSVPVVALMPAFSQAARLACGRPPQRRENVCLQDSPGGTVERATTETDGSTTAAYELIVTRPDGTRAKVVEDASFAVLSVGTTGCR